MYNSNIPSDRALPSTKRLLKSTVIAAAAAAVLLVTTILPAEYGIDPTGIGEALNLKKMGEIKISLAEEVAADAAEKAQENVRETDVPIQAAAPKETPVVQENTSVKPVGNQDTATVTLVPNQAAEIKVKMRKGEIVAYKWSSDAGKVNFDVHADSKALEIDYLNYEKGAAKIKEGLITAAFDGYHGWFWRNRSDKPLTITLEVSGDYEYMKHLE